MKNQKRKIIALRWRLLATAAAACTMHRHLLLLFCILLCNIGNCFSVSTENNSQTIRSVHLGEFHFWRICDTRIQLSSTTKNSTAPCECMCVYGWREKYAFISQLLPFIKLSIHCLISLKTQIRGGIWKSRKKIGCQIWALINDSLQFQT